MMARKGPPIDRGWAWVIAGGLFVKSFITGGFIKSYGVFFSAFLETYGRSASETQLIRSARSICATMGGPIGTALSERFTERVIVMTGAFVMSMGFILAFFANSLEYMIFTFGICTGFGVAMVNGPSKVCLGRYFDKKRGRANSLALVGTAIGQIAVPPLVSILMSAYSLRGAMLIYGGVSLHTVITGALMRPLSSYGTKHPDETDTAPVKNGDTSGDIAVQEESGFHDDMDQQLPLNGSAVHGASNSDEKGTNKKDINKLTPEPLQIFRSPHNCRHSFKAAESIGDSSLSLTDRFKNIGSTLTVNSLPDEETCDLQNIPHVPNNVKKPSVCSIIIGFIKSVFDLRVLTNPLYHLFIVCTSLFMVTNGNQVTFLVPRAQEMGLSREMAAVLVSIIGGCDIFGRLMLGVLADVKKFPTHLVMAVGVSLTSLTMFVLPSTKSFGEMAAVAALFGIFGSSHSILNLPVMVDFIGKDLLAKAVGMSILFYGASNAVFAPLLGLVKDKVGTYNAVFYVTASLQLFAALLLASLEPMARRNHKKKFESDSISIDVPAVS